eukprot:1809715-Pyramimonas_sp.AAC.1
MPVRTGTTARAKALLCRGFRRTRVARTLGARHSSLPDSSEARAPARTARVPGPFLELCARLRVVRLLATVVQNGDEHQEK